MFDVVINWWAVIVCAVVSMVIGFIWYSMALFGKPWMEAVGMKQEDMKKGPGAGYAVAVLAALVTAYVLAHFVDYAGATTVAQGAATGFWAWLGFIATSMGMNAIFENRPAKLYWINVGMQLVNLVVMGMILAAWR